MTLHLRRFDRMDLARPILRPDGSKIVEGVIAREGILEYERPDGSIWREYVPADTLRDSAKGLIGRPVTVEHPPEDVTPDNWKEFAVGTVLDAVYDEQTGELRGVMTINDREILDAVEGGKIELSPGYLADLDDMPGSSESGSFDAAQAARVYNHVAFVDEARGGPSVRARVDAANHVICDTTTRSATMALSPLVLALAARYGLGTNFNSDDEAIRALHRRADNLNLGRPTGDNQQMGYPAKTDQAPPEEEKADEVSQIPNTNVTGNMGATPIRAADAGGIEGFETMDAGAQEMQRLRDENARMREMLDSMMAEKERDTMAPLMDAYGETMRSEDRADSMYTRLYTKITGQKADGVDKAEVRGVVQGHYAAMTAQRNDGIAAGRAAWERAFGGTLNIDRQDPEQHAHRRDDSRDRDLFRPGPSALTERRYNAAHRSMMERRYDHALKIETRMRVADA